MKRADFRAELMKIMPGYKWTISVQSSPGYLIATGTQLSGSNRLSTLRVIRSVSSLDGAVKYEARSAGFGRRAPWLHSTTSKTLARALRNLQDHYESMASMYSSHAGALKVGRAAKGGAS